MTTIPRRRFLRATALLCGGMALSACSPSAPTTSAPAPTAAPPAALPSSSVASASPAASPSAAVPASPVAQVAPTAGGALIPVKAAWVVQVVQQMPFAVGVEAGYFRKYGLDFQLSYVNGSNNAIAAITAHDLDVAIGSGAAVVSAQAGGADALLVLSSYGKSYFKVMAPASIATMDDLKGKTAAVSKVGSGTDYFYLLAVMKYLGWGPDDLTFVSGGDNAGTLAMVQQGQVQCVIVTPPSDITAEDLGLHSVFDTSTIDLPDVQSAVILGRDYLNRNRDAVTAIVQGCVEAVHRWKTDEQFTEAVIQKYMQPSDPRFVTQGWQDFAQVFVHEPLISREGMLAVIDQVTAQTPEAKNVDVDKTFDNSLVQGLIDNGFIRQVYAS